MSLLSLGPVPVAELCPLDRLHFLYVSIKRSLHYQHYREITLPLQLANPIGDLLWSYTASSPFFVVIFLELLISVCSWGFMRSPDAQPSLFTASCEV